MSKKLEEMSAAELQAQADALLAAAELDAVDMEEIPVKPLKRSSKKKAAPAEAPVVMTDEEAKKAAFAFLNEFGKLQHRNRTAIETAILLLSPMAPHICEELWSRYGHAETLAYYPWPKFDEAKLAVDEIEILVQLNGKPKVRLMAPAKASKDELLAFAKANPEVAALLEGKTLVKEIAEEYVDVCKTESVQVADGKFYLDVLTMPVKAVKRVQSNGVRVAFREREDHVVVTADGTVQVTYAYYPDDLALDEEIRLPRAVTQRALVYGVASEYCMLKERFEESANLNARYVTAMASAVRPKRGIRVKERFWS